MEKSELKYGALFTVGEFGTLPLKGFMEMPEHNGVVKTTLFFHSPDNRIIEAAMEDVTLIVPPRTYKLRIEPD